MARIFVKFNRGIHESLTEVNTFFRDSWMNFMIEFNRNTSVTKLPTLSQVIYIYVCYTTVILIVTCNLVFAKKKRTAVKNWRR